MIRLYTCLLVCIPFVVGCSRNSIPSDLSAALRNAPVLDLHSLDPAVRDEEPVSSFHMWKDLGSTDVSATNVRSRLLDSLDAAVTDNDGVVAACFEPRHGLRGVYEGKTYDVIICFKCYQAYWYIDGVKQPAFLLTNIAKETFDTILIDGNVELPPSTPE